MSRKREDLLRVGEHYPGHTFAVDQWTGVGQHPASALVVAHNCAHENGTGAAVFPEPLDTDAKDLVFADGTWTRAPDPTLDSDEPDEEFATGDLLKRIKRLQQDQEQMAGSFEQRVRESATQLLRDANQDKADVEIIPVSLSEAERRKTNAWPISSETRAADWKRGPDRAFNLLELSDEVPKEDCEEKRMLALRNVLFECSLQRDDRARLLRTCPALTGYATPFSHI